MNVFDLAGQKPSIKPPSVLSEPDVASLETLYAQEEATLDDFKRKNPAGAALLTKVREGIEAAIAFNFNSINQYMEESLYRGKIGLLDQLPGQVSYAANASSACAWMIGRKWALRDDAVRALAPKAGVTIEDVPTDALELLLRAAYIPYWLFATIMTEYYDSPYGRRTRNQKADHLTDTYQSFLYGLLMCFHLGVKSVSRS